MIELEGAVQDIYNLLTAPQIVSNMYTQVARVQSCTSHLQHTECYHMQHVVPRGTKGQLSY